MSELKYYERIYEILFVSTDGYNRIKKTDGYIMYFIVTLFQSAIIFCHGTTNDKLSSLITFVNPTDTNHHEYTK